MIKRIIIVMLVAMMSLTVLVGCNENGGQAGGTSDINKPGRDQPRNEIVVDVMGKYYEAKGDGVTSDRKVIQQAIDDVHNAGGGTVLLTAGHTFLSGNLLLRSNVTLLFGDGAVLLQNDDPNDYIEMRGFDYKDGIAGNYGYIEKGEHYLPFIGVNQLPYDERIWPESTGFWREVWNWNYPLIYADRGTENVRIIGNGNATIQSTHYTHENREQTIFMLLIGFYRVDNFIISGITLNHEHSHCYNFNNCTNGLINEVVNITPASISNNMADCASVCDGLKLVNSQNILVKNCLLAGGDDSCLIISSYGDTRYDRWASSTDMMECKNLEFSGCTFPSYFKGLGFCGLGMMCPERDKVEISDVYIHDCNFCSVGIWEGFGWINLPDDKQPNYGYYNPMKNIRWENNNYEYWPGEYNYDIPSSSIQAGMQKYPVSDQISDDPRLHSMTDLRNADFENTRLAYWIDVTKNGSLAECRKDGENSVGYLGDLEKGNAKLYEGLYLEKGTYTLKAKIKSSDGAIAKLFVTDQKDANVASTHAQGGDWTTVELTFTIENAGNYRLGVEGTTAGSVMFDDLQLVR